MTADQELKKINDALIANPKLRACFLEMIDTAADETGELNNGDDVKDAVIGVIEKTGRELLQGWLEKKAEQAEIKAEADPTIRPHEKKDCLAYDSWKHLASSSRVRSQEKQENRKVPHCSYLYSYRNKAL